MKKSFLDKAIEEGVIDKKTAGKIERENKITAQCDEALQRLYEDVFDGLYFVSREFLVEKIEEKEKEMLERFLGIVDSAKDQPLMNYSPPLEHSEWWYKGFAKAVEIIRKQLKKEIKEFKI